MKPLNLSPGSDGLRERRAAAGFTQQTLAAEARCSIASVAMFDGGYRPTARSAVYPRILAALERAERTNGDREEPASSVPGS
jgi:predicted transcriptional regulator